MSLFAQSLQQFTDGAGRPASSVVRFYRSGTTPPVAVFKDPGFTSPHPVDIRSDSLGSIPPIHMKPDGIKLRAEITTNGTKTRALDDIDPGLETTDVTPSAMSLPNNPLTGAGITIAVDDFGTFVQITTTTGEAILGIRTELENVQREIKSTAAKEEKLAELRAEVKRFKVKQGVETAVAMGQMI